MRTATLVGASVGAYSGDWSTDADARSLAAYVVLALQMHVESTPEPKAKPRKS